MSTTVPAPGQSCLDVSYSDTAPLCTMSGANRSCVFPATPAAVPGLGCFALMVTRANGAPAGAQGNQFNWQAACSP